MTILSRFHRIIGNSADTANTAPGDDPIVIQLQAGDKEGTHATDNEIPDKDDNKPTENAQAGVQKIEAVTLTWGRSSMFMVLIL